MGWMLEIPKGEANSYGHKKWSGSRRGGGKVAGGLRGRKGDVGTKKKGYRLEAAALGEEVVR